ncbi:hypothetical protein GCM10023107_61430 [Actinoplanes octamycinicus]|nr:hypothetical protein [Actinoplanes octamycinicus]GIE55798.1 hypothetical protein Aoc01nite_12000 [Actinoplanes octamycinicus]
MVDLRGISEDVPFDWDAADRLATQLRSAADACEGQISRRTSLASHASQEWRGVYGRQFGGRMDICTGDARRLATAMRTAANQVDELARLAREEQDRREKARAWAAEQEDESFLEKVGDFFLGEDEDDLPPIPPPVTPPHYTVAAPTAPSRE